MIKKLLGILCASIFVAASFFSDFTFACADSELQAYDVYVNRIAKKRDKTIKVRGFIGKPDSSTGEMAFVNDLSDTNIAVFGNSKHDGSYGFNIDAFGPVNIKDDPHYNMYSFMASGIPEYEEGTFDSYYITICTYQEGEKAFCSKIHIDSSKTKKSEALSHDCAEEVDAELAGFMILDEDDKKEQESATCMSENGAWGYVFCPAVAGLQSGISTIYTDLISDWLAIDPSILKVNNNVTGATAQASSANTVHEAWGALRTFANLALIVMLLVMIVSQITGYGISNYGVKKFLPRVLVTAIIINFSYFICQVALDLSNIFGKTVFGYFEGMSNSIDIRIDGNLVVGSTALIVALVAAISFVILNPATLIPIILGLIAGLISVLTLFITLGVREALAIVLVVISPIAVFCYNFPNLKSFYTRWFNMMKAVLVAYPLCSLFVAGASFGGRVLLASWGASKWYAILAAFLISVLPYFALPKTILNSLSLISATVNRINDSIKKRSTNTLRESTIAESADMSLRERTMRRKAGIKIDKETGRVIYKPLRFSKIAPRFRMAVRANYEDAAMQSIQKKQNSEAINKFGATKYINNSETAAIIREGKKRIQTMHLTENEITTRMNAAAKAGDAASTAAFAHTLAGMSSGRADFNSFLDDGDVSDEVKRTVAGAFTDKDIDGMYEKNPYAAQYIRNVQATDAGSPLQSYSSTTLDAEALSKITVENFGKFSSADQDRIIAEGSSYATDSAEAVVYAQFMEELSDNLKLVHEGEGTANVEGQLTLSPEARQKVTDVVEERNKQIDGKFSTFAPPGSAGVANNDLAGGLNYYASLMTQAANSNDTLAMEAAAKGMKAWAKDFGSQAGNDLADSRKQCNEIIMATTTKIISDRTKSNAVWAQASLINSRIGRDEI